MENHAAVNLQKISRGLTLLDQITIDLLVPVIFLLTKTNLVLYSGTAGVLVSAVVPEGLRVLPGHATHWPPVMLRHSMPIPIRGHTRDGLQGEILILCYF